MEISKIILPQINQEIIKSQEIKLETYWKSDDIIVAEIKLELQREITINEKDYLLNSIAGK